jgi:quinol monooxygenase YgiN
MLIALVEFHVAPADRPAALKVLLDEAPGVRRMPGNRRFLPFPDPASAGGVTLYHEWEDEAGFAAYLAGPGFAAVGQTLRPMMTAPPLSRRFRASLIETLA